MKDNHVLLALLSIVLGQLFVINLLVCMALVKYLMS